MVLSPEASLSSGSNKESGKSMEKKDGRSFYHQAGEGSSRNFDMDPNSENPWSTPSEMWEQEEALMSSQTQMQLNFLNQKDLPLEGLSHPYYPKEGSLGGIGHSYEEIVPVNQTLHDMIIPMAGVQSLHNGLPGDSLGDAMSKESCEREIKQEMRADSSDGSDPMDEDEEKGSGSRSGRRHLSKNLVAERKRRKKLNERLYALRALVPKITKMDRASILGDAIEYVRELQSRVDNLHKELLEDEDILDVETILEDGIKDGCLEDIKSSDPRLDTILEDQRVESFVQPLEVSVHKLEDNCFCVRILSEKSEGIFLSVLRVMDDFGFDILHANLITFRGIALNVFNAEVKDQKVPLVEEVKESLLQICKAREIADDSLHLMNSNLSHVLDG